MAASIHPATGLPDLAVRDAGSDRSLRIRHHSFGTEAQAIAPNHPEEVMARAVRPAPQASPPGQERPEGADSTLEPDINDPAISTI